jgi:BirA family transcriptional regulator, biotin operon repressor / biotin---[acetyl-CoA-carboxylase] ligase
MAITKTTDQRLQAVLEVLRGAREPISGERLAAQMGLSRAAVWKHMHRLKDMGYTIEGSPRRGYRLLATPDKLLPDEVLQGLKTRKFRGPVYHFETLDSTNNYAKELGARGAPEGTLVTAEAQTGGRGRLGRTWNSPPGVGLYVSVVLRPMLPPMELPQITLTTAVAVVRAVRRLTGGTPGIKWPNDLLINGQKLGGILTEMETESDRIRHAVVGLGLNVNNPDFPPELAATATSLIRVVGSPVPRVRLLQAWLEEFEDLYEQFLNRGFAEILPEWKDYTVTLGRPATVRQGSQVLRGQAVDVAPDGALLLRTLDGEIVRVTSGEITPEPEPGPGAES